MRCRTFVDVIDKVQKQGRQKPKGKYILAADVMLINGAMAGRVHRTEPSEASEARSDARGLDSACDTWRPMQLTSGTIRFAGVSPRAAKPPASSLRVQATGRGSMTKGDEAWSFVLNLPGRGYLSAHLHALHR